VTDNLTPCMGGNCSRREQCQHYHSTSEVPPSESLCARTGNDWFLAVDPQPKDEATQ